LPVRTGSGYQAVHQRDLVHHQHHLADKQCQDSGAGKRLERDEEEHGRRQRLQEFGLYPVRDGSHTFLISTGVLSAGKISAEQQRMRRRQRLAIVDGGGVELSTRTRQQFAQGHETGARGARIRRRCDVEDMRKPGLL
jgi:hypothetical protein